MSKPGRDRTVPPARRAVLLSGLAGAGAVAGAGVIGRVVTNDAGSDDPGSRAPTSGSAAHATIGPFRHDHQHGILDPPPAYATFVALDLVEGADHDAVRRLLTVWTEDIERMTSGRPGLTDLERELASVPASLTVTVGVGPGLVAVVGAEAPAWLAPLPGFEVDALEPRWCGGDLFLQVCATSPTTVAHTHRRLVTGAAGLASPRWVQRGFREPHQGPGVPMRNLFGQVDGTIQPDVAGADAGLLWSGDAAPAWLHRGSSVVVRRIRMDLDAWDRVDRASRENAVGRRLDSGGPVTGGDELAAPDFEARDELGFTRIDLAAHIRRAHATAPHERFLRRPYSYDDGAGAAGDSGLVFVAYQADPLRQFVPVQRRLAEQDLMNLWVTPVGSAVFAILPGPRPGEILGEAMLS
ncbi:MAG: Dyp-type peroxidase [Dermatophilaceae bacterium]